MDVRSTLLNLILQTDEGSWKARIGDFIDRVGLFQFRIVRWLFAIDDERINTIHQACLERIQKVAPRVSRTAQEWQNFINRWKLEIKLPIPEKARLPVCVGIEKHKPIEPKPVEADEKVVRLEMRLEIPKISHSVTNPRSKQMEEVLQSLEAYDKENKLLHIGAKDYRVVTARVHEFADSPNPLVSCGSTPGREMILLDPEQSPILQKLYRHFSNVLIDDYLKRNSKPFTAEELAIWIIAYMQGQVFTSKEGEQEVNKIVEECAKNPDIIKQDTHPCIPIDVFLKAKAGVCRHHALVAAYFLDRLIQHHPQLFAFKGKIQVMRDNLEREAPKRSGAHVWLTLVCENGETWCIDTLNQICGNLADSKFLEILIKNFGIKTVEHQIKKAVALREELKRIKFFIK